MAITAAAITKSTPWRGGIEKWSNVYHFFSAANLDVTNATDLVAQLQAAEQACHTAAVNFEEGRVWEAGGTAEENETILLKTLSGVGTLAGSSLMWPELAIVVKCDTNRNTSTGRRIYLRKYYHSQSAPSMSAAMATGTSVLTGTQYNPMKTCMETVRELALAPGGLAVQLCAPGGQLVSDARPVTVLPYPHIRQFKQ